MSEIYWITSGVGIILAGLIYRKPIQLLEFGAIYTVLATLIYILFFILETIYL